MCAALSSSSLLHVLLCQFTIAQEQKSNNLRGLRETATQVEEAAEAASFHISLLNAVNVERTKAQLPPLCMCR